MGMEILVCVKRVPTVGGKIAVTPDGQEVDTRMSGFSISPHEECAVEEAVQITEQAGGSVSVLTLGPEAAIEQLRGALALGAGRAVLLETDGREYRGVEEAYELPLPAVITVKEGINLPRYPSLPGRLRAKRAAVERSSPAFTAEGLRMQALRVPESGRHQATVLGHGTDAVPELVRVLAEWGVLS